MNAMIQKQLGRLSDIADLKSDQAKSRLATAQAEKERIVAEISAIESEIRETLHTAKDPLALYLAARFSDLKRSERSALMTELAQCELERKRALREAQHEEGRRIAISELKARTRLV